eukprot:TRINITY_DN5605_c0_g1_i2.p1 TRINITY_DN5605_c0_g1~~TRINITY_DN5605_c0_g1_i2.p1  ORF type:complete len:155 (+),score=51.86 TRINITY_DN5605_c0_g1_i2:89-553(+)
MTADNLGPVKTVVGDTFDEVVLLSSKNVVLNFFASWCVHSQVFMKEYKKAAEEMSGDDSILFVQMDYMENTIHDDRFPVTSFPTLYLVTVRREVVLLFEGLRSSKEVVTFVQKYRAPVEEGPAYNVPEGCLHSGSGEKGVAAAAQDMCGWSNDE